MRHSETTGGAKAGSASVRGGGFIGRPGRHLRWQGSHGGRSGGPVTLEPLEGRQLLSTSLNSFTQTNLVSDTASIPAARTDPNLVNAWGVAINPSNGAVWVNANGKGLSTAFMDNGASTGPMVTIPAPPGSSGPSAPTGIVLNPSRGFAVSNGTTSAPARFLFATEDGTIAAWNPNVDATNAFLKVDNSASGAVFKGITMATVGRSRFIYAADFHNGKVDVFNSRFAPVTRAGAFEDPNIPAGFAPFDVQAIGNRIFVTYAKQDAAQHDDVKGAGNGFVDVFNARGQLQMRFASGGTLNSPWAVVRAPRNFGPFGGDILIGNFGDGRINVFSRNGQFITQLQDSSGTPMTINGLWGMRFGNGVNAGNRTTLFFAAGPNDEADGLFGTLTPAGGTTPAGRRSTPTGNSMMATSTGGTSAVSGVTSLGTAIGFTGNELTPSLGNGLMPIQNGLTPTGNSLMPIDNGLTPVNTGGFFMDNGMMLM